MKLAGRPRLSALVTLTVGLGGLALPRGVAAQQVIASDCNAGFADIYNKGDAVCVTGDLDYVPPNKIFPEAYIYVIPLGHGNAFADVSGAPNYIMGTGFGGAFYDEYVWLPLLKSGKYEFVIDNHPFFMGDGAAFDPNKDLRTGHAFTVSDAPTVWSVDPAMIKAEAFQGFENALRIRVMMAALSGIDAISTVLDWSVGFGVGGAIAGGVVGVVCTVGGWDCPTSYNSAVIAIGNRILGGFADSLEKKYLAIIADPPDPNFGAPVPLDLDELKALGFPATPRAEHPFARAQAQFANLLALQSAAYIALVPSLEKVQGAQEAGDNLGMLIQSEKVKAYAELAIAAGDRLVAEADAFEMHLQGAGILDAGYDMASFNAALQAFKDGGLSEEERSFVYSFGITDAEIAEATAIISAWEPVQDDLNYGSVAHRVRQSYLTFRPALVDLVDQAEKVRAENDEVTLRPGPKLSIAAPAPGKVGVPQAIDAGAMHFDPQAPLEYAWDLDLDGEFDDGAGAQVMFTPSAPGLMLVSARVSDGVHVDYAYAFVDVTISNAPPEVTVLEPFDPAPFADVGEVITLHVEASDPDGDPTTISWTVDGVPAGVGPDLDFTMPDEEAHRISITIADDDPYSPDVTIGRVIRAGKWESMAGDTTGGTDSGGTDSDGTDSGGTDSGGTDTGGGDTTGGTGGTDSPTSGGGDSNSGADTEGPTSGGAGGSAGTSGADTSGGAGDTGGSQGEGGGCGCRNDAGSQGPWLLALALLGVVRRRKAG